MKVLLVHASLGWGHQRAAEALQEVLQKKGIQSEVRDLLKFLPSPMKAFYPWSYSFLVTHGRLLWKLLYHWNDWPAWPYAPARSYFQKWQFFRFRDYVWQQNFTHILSTHFASSALLLDWREEGGDPYKLYTVITDFTAHRCWKRTGFEHYFVPCSRVADQLADYGVSRNDISISGIPISPSFSVLSRRQCRERYGIAEKQTALLVLTSGLNLRRTYRLMEELKATKGNIRFLVSAGKLPARENGVRQVCKDDPRFFVFGFSDRIAEMMRAADLLISKPGGLTVSEALASGLPSILFSPIPGQEEANAEFVVRGGAGLCIKAKPGEFYKAVTRLMENPEEMEKMKKAASSLGKPDAAEQIVNQVLSAESVS